MTAAVRHCPADRYVVPSIPLTSRTVILRQGSAQDDGERRGDTYASIYHLSSIFYLLLSILYLLPSILYLLPSITYDV